MQNSQGLNSQQQSPAVDSRAPAPPSRFEVELEFVQALANPQYANFLAQNGYLEDERFINYLEYLEYWRKPEYVKYLIYPNCLHVLSLLKQPLFRQEVRHADMAQMLMDDMYTKWLGAGRYRLMQTESIATDKATPGEHVAGDGAARETPLATNGTSHSGDRMEGIERNGVVKSESS
ncbi:SOH1-domain-containing protein [Lipomyces tetrasporus]|uniref:Mediator of RNA polymerase II transcription subunit 31 n=1 Tax=Lipomyces tetrasporus TaxID=54092 RepID=A0AAD7QTG3_9ASCO|nr:SOH1-domain-containing protein [Lipomyces tetrasporus]KAJ8100701.1 SOH1-domain-containing protein [Lipomyces tetrasporus]